MSTIIEELQLLNQSSPYIELYELDCTALGGLTYHFTNNLYENGTQVVWQGNNYTFIPIQSTGWEIMGGTANGSTSQPTPTITVSNVNKILLNAVVTLGDIVGAKLTRYRTFQKFLDGQPAEDSSEFLGPDVYYINQKVAHNNSIISFQLINPIDLPGKYLPGRQILKDAPDGFPGVLVYR